MLYNETNYIKGCLLMFCQKCGKEINDEAVICIHCGCAVNSKPNTYKIANEDDKKSVGLNVLSFFIPLFGWIYGGINHKTYPIKAKGCIVSAFIGFGVSLLCSIIYLFVGALLYLY